MGAHCVKVGNDPEPMEYFKSPPAMLLVPIALALLQQGFEKGSFTAVPTFRHPYQSLMFACLSRGCWRAQGPWNCVKHVDMSLQHLLVEIDFPVFDHFSIQCMAAGYLKKKW